MGVAYKEKRGVHIGILSLFLLLSTAQTRKTEDTGMKGVNKKGGKELMGFVLVFSFSFLFPA